MRVHRSVGHVNFVTAELVLGASGEPRALDALLERLEPSTVAVDLSIEDLGAIRKGEIDDPWIIGQAEAAEEHADHEVLDPYKRLIDWVGQNEADLQPMGSRTSVGLSKARRIKRTIKRVEADDDEQRARAAIQALMDDAQVGPLAERRRTTLAERLESLLRREPPRTLAVFTFPWGEMVSTDVRRAMGLRRMDGEQAEGGWPD